MEKVEEIPRLPPRRRDAHKGDFGKVLVLAGSRGMVGAAALAGDAALRSGAGLVTVATPEGTYPILAAKLTCCTTCPLPETPTGGLSDRARREILKLVEEFDVVAIGPGLGRDPSTARLVRALVATVPRPMVIDADGLNALAEAPLALRRAPGPRVLTPHPGEMARLAGMTTAEVQSARSRVAASLARKYGVVVALKGHRSIVTDGKMLFTNPTGNPGMATGGTGDVLTGTIAALIGQGLAPFEAAVLGVYVHGLAGDIAARKFGEISLIATDVLDSLPAAFQRVARPYWREVRPGMIHRSEN